jgi:hypothetical protein
MSREKKRGRPRGPPRPVVAARIPQALYDDIKAAGIAAGRTISAELVWRAERAGNDDDTLRAVCKAIGGMADKIVSLETKLDRLAQP